MKRLTTDKPDGNFETILNFVYGKDGWAHIRYDGENEDVPLYEWARKQCLSRWCDEFPAETPEEIDQEICDCMMDCPDCPVALAYCFASQAVNLRDRLKMYEEILFSENGTELISLDRLREIVSRKDNPPLTLEELREMTKSGVAVWCHDADGIAQGLLCMQEDWYDNCKSPHIWLLDEESHAGVYSVRFMLECGAKFYRRKPEEGTVWQQ